MKCPTNQPRVIGVGGILGVPTSSGVAVFSYAHDEVIRCWDIRQPACHAYTLSTGNLRATDLAWHAPSNSLLAATSNPHAVSHGKYTSVYQYGDRVEESTEDELAAGQWPRGAQNDANFFPARFNGVPESCGGYRCVLQYPFLTPP